MRALVDLAREVSTIHHDDGPARAGEHARALLGDWHRTGAVFRHLDAIAPNHYEGIASRISRMTDTHMKWFICMDEGGSEIWLHQFRSPREVRRAHRFAASVHDHRYGFASLILRGGYTHETHKVTVRDGELCAGAKARDVVTGTERYTSGDAYVLDHSVFHRLSDVEPETSTLVVQLPPQKRSSLSLSRRSRVLEHADFGRDFERMVQACRPPATGVPVSA